jgi:hypothetical protein
MSLTRVTLLTTAAGLLAAVLPLCAWAWDTPPTDAPEPATLGLLSLGLLGMAFVRRGRPRD